MQQSIPAQPAFGGAKALIGALILGAIAAGLIVAFLASRDSGGDSVSTNGARVSVVVAGEDIAAGAKITSSMVETRQVPRNSLIAGALTASESVVGQTARYPILQGEQIASARILESKGSKSISFQIPAGLRGFTIKVETSTSPAGLMAPGDFVDVIVSGDMARLSPLVPGRTVVLADGEKPKAAVTLLQKVQVLSVQRKRAESAAVYDSSTRGDPPGDKDEVSYVMLALTPEQAQLLWLASQENKVTLALRPFGDEGVTDLAPVAEPIRVK